MRVILGQSPPTTGCDANQDQQINMGDVTAIYNILADYYTEYDPLGNITFMNGKSYSYTSGRPHAVTSAGSTSYTYDANGNMTARGNQTMTWDEENRLASITTGGVNTVFVYDGDGNRVKKTEGDQTTLYINKYYEKNLTTSEVTTHYYFGNKEIAVRKGAALSYLLQDSLGSTSVISDASGTSSGSILYFPFAGCGRRLRNQNYDLPSNEAKRA